MRLLITGANGFIGKALRRSHLTRKYDIRPIYRNSYSVADKDNHSMLISEIDENTCWNEAIVNCDIVVHLAARAHILRESAIDPLKEYQITNVGGTLNLATSAARAGVKRFVFISSIGVNGTSSVVPFTEELLPNPKEPYAVSKLEAEQGLLSLAKSTGMEVVIIRPPLVYGVNAPGNFRRLIRSVNRNILLPLGAIHNQRSLVALDNLVSFIIHCIDHPKAANEVFLISDGEDVSTTELLQKVAKAFGKKPRLIPIPVGLMKLAARLVGKGDMANRLFGSLQVDSSKARDLLGWKPVITMDEQLRKIAQAKNINAEFKC